MAASSFRNPEGKKTPVRELFSPYLNEVRISHNGSIQTCTSCICHDMACHDQNKGNLGSSSVPEPCSKTPCLVVYVVLGASVSIPKPCHALSSQDGLLATANVTIQAGVTRQAWQSILHLQKHHYNFWSRHACLAGLLMSLDPSSCHSPPCNN